MGILWENTTPSTELPRDFCAGIGPLQCGVLLVFISNFSCYVCNRQSQLFFYCHNFLTSNKQNHQLRWETKTRKIRTKVIYDIHHNYAISRLRHLYRTCWTVTNDVLNQSIHTLPSLPTLHHAPSSIMLYTPS